MPNKPFRLFILGEAPIAYPAVDHNDGNIALSGDADKIRPDFQLHQQTDRGLDSPKGAAYNPGKIEREIKNLMIRAEKRRRAGEAGIRGRTDDELKITEPDFKLSDKGLGRVDLAHADGVEPDTRLFRTAATDLTKPLPPAHPIAIVPDNPIDHHRAISHTDEHI